MINLQRLSIGYFCEDLKNAYSRMYSNLEPQFGNIIVWTARLALEIISNSNALYHNVDHTIMVTLAGQSILEGKHLVKGGVTPNDWLHFMIALLCHDIGYVRGVCSQDGEGLYATGIGDETIKIAIGGTDVALTPYHVDRSKRFVMERFGSNLLNGMEKTINSERVASLIEHTRFPIPKDDEHADTAGYPGLLRAADFIGQLGDPNYLRKIPALYYEFEETGNNEKRGYKTPGDLRLRFAKFYWDEVTPYIQEAMSYLRMTQDGKQWLANMHSHVIASQTEGF